MHPPPNLYIMTEHVWCAKSIEVKFLSPLLKLRFIYYSKKELSYSKLLFFFSNSLKQNQVFILFDRFVHAPSVYRIPLSLTKRL